MPKWYDSKVIRLADESPTVRRFWLEVPADTPLQYRAGQFVTFDLPVAEKRLDRWRSYSIASAPDASQLLELCVVHLDGGRGSGYLFSEIGVGDTLRTKGPDGVFTLPEPVTHDLVMVCTGTGVAPFRAMIRDLHDGGKPHRNIHLIFGCRRVADILYREEFADLQRTMPGFSYTVALSREPNLRAADFDFPVVAGYVHQVYEQAYARPDPERHFYLCGWQRMIDEALQRLTEQLGYNSEQIRYELYG